jgi:hypothetical protein
VTLALIRSGNDFCTLLNLKEFNLVNRDLYKVMIREPEGRRQWGICRH